MSRSLVLALSIVLAAGGCSAGSPSTQIAKGRRIYGERCASCHDAEDATGPRLTRDLLASYYTARALYDYVEMSMPFDQPGSLTGEEYWESVAFLLESRSLFDGQVHLSAQTADSVVLRPAPPR